MKVKIKRNEHSVKATIGELKIEDVDHEPIYTLENPERETTIDNRIPAGEYNCKPYSGLKYKDVYIVENVKGREGILFHWGNTEKDTLGCILLGNKIGQIGSEPAILESKKCFERFRKLVGKNNFTLVIEN
jgi:hypothetical protein